MAGFAKHLAMMMIPALAFVLFASLPATIKVAALQTDGTISVFGAVKTPLNLTYDRLLSFPMVSEVARIKCVIGQPDAYYNWTGVPLFYILTLAQVKSDAYKIAVLAQDGFSSDLLIEDALRPTTIIALEANGTSLPQLTNGPAGPYRLVVPGKWGYKWVAAITAIEVVTTDYLGTYESAGVPSWTDDATVSNYGPMPTPSPPVQTFSFPYGNRTLEFQAFTNGSITAIEFDYLQKTVNLNMTTEIGASGFADFFVQRDFLGGPYNVTLDGTATSAVEADTNASSILYVAFGEGSHAISLSGTEFFGLIPEIIVDYSVESYVGQSTIFDASRSVDYGRIVSYNWSFGDGGNATGAVVAHTYVKEGMYQVTVVVTNDNGTTNLKMFTVTVQNPVPFILQAILSAFLILLVVMFLAIIFRRRRPRAEEENQLPHQP